MRKFETLENEQTKQHKYFYSLELNIKYNIGTIHYYLGVNDVS